MPTAKRLIIAIAAFTAALGAGYGTYTLAGPTAAERAAVSHEGHDHGEHAGEEAHAEEEETAHRGHDHGEEGGEDLEDLFAADDTAAESHPVEEDGHAGHDHASHAPAAVDPHAGHAHAAEATAAADPHAGHDHGSAEGEFCPEHQLPEAEDALCQGGRIGDLHPGQGMKVRLPSPQAAGRVGIAAALPVVAGDGAVAWPAQVVFNRDRLARLSALAAGTLRTVNVGLGEKIRAGAVLAEIAAPEASGLRAEAAAAASRLDLAQTAYQREKDLLAKGITSRQDFEQAEAEWRQAQSAAARTRQQLGDYGLAADGQGATVPVKSPFTGTIVERHAVAGEAVAAGAPLFTVADLSTFWVEVSVPEDALLDLHSGQAVNAVFPALPARVFSGKIFWLAPALDEKTRMLKALAAVDNRDGLLRSGLFGQVQPASGQTAGALAVPTDALQTIDGQPFLFVQLEEDLYELRRVAAGRRAGGTVHIAEGLQPRDRVVTAQAFALKSEVLKARLGASCADH